MGVKFGMGDKMGLTDEIADLIQKWMASRKGATLSMLAKLSGVHYNTVQRLAQREVIEPTLDSMLALVPVLLPREKYGNEGTAFLLRHFPKTGYFAQSLAENGIEPLIEIGALENFNRNDFLILALAATKSGLRKELAIEKIGRDPALDSIAKLHTAGVLVQDGDVYRSSKETFQILGSERVIKEIIWLCESFNFKMIDRHGSLYRFITQGLTEDAVLRIHRILFQASAEIEKIVCDPQNHGDQVLGYGIVSTFIHTNSEGASR
jgi:hypothetical protein